MKRMFLVCSILVLSLFLCAYASAESPQLETDPLYLAQTEYCVYQGDEFVTTYVNANFGLGGRCSFNRVSSLFNIPVENLNTKRNIRIGSTLDDIATAYDGIRFTCFSQDLFNEPIGSLVQMLNTNESIEILTWTYFVDSEYMLDKGVPVVDEDAQSALKAAGKSITADLFFEIEQGNVTDIILFAK